MRKFQYFAPALLLSLVACQNAGVNGTINPEIFAGSRDLVSSEITGSIKPVEISNVKDANASKIVINSYRPPKVGTVFGWRNNWASLEPKLVYRVASLNDKFDGKPAIRFEAIEGTGKGAKTYYDLQNSNLVGHKDKSGKPLVTYQKVENRLKFPMRPGDKWVANWQYLDHNSNKVQKGGGVVNVIGVELLSTDAGRFKTMKIRLPLPASAGRGMRHHIWYSPKLGIIVREQISNNTFSWVKVIERVELTKG
ncbi:MAG: hypothetical protein QM488_09020 [Rhizobiaceae bacterium]